MRRDYQITLEGFMTKATAEEVGRRYLAERMHTFPSSVAVTYADPADALQEVTVEDDGARYVVAKQAAWLCLAACVALGIALGWAIAALVLVVLR